MHIGACFEGAADSERRRLALARLRARFEQHGISGEALDARIERLGPLLRLQASNYAADSATWQAGELTGTIDHTAVRSRIKERVRTLIQLVGRLGGAQLAQVRECLLTIVRGILEKHGINIEFVEE